MILIRALTIHQESSCLANLRVSVRSVCYASHGPRTKVLPVKSSVLNDPPRHRSTPDRGVRLILKLLVKLVDWEGNQVLHCEIDLTILPNVVHLLLLGLRLLGRV